jgi:hypothetical protein
LEESLASGSTVEHAAEAVKGDAKYQQDFIGDDRNHAYYATEFVPVLNISVSFECRTPVCEVKTANQQNRVEFLENAQLSIKTSCRKTGGSAVCMVVFDGSSGSAKRLRQSGSPLFNKLIAKLEPEIEQYEISAAEMKNKNPIEKAVLLWSGEPQKRIITATALTARYGLIASIAHSDLQYFDKAQRKYGLKFPDGSKTPERFLSHAKQIAERIVSKYPTLDETYRACAESLDNAYSDSQGLISRGAAKLGVRTQAIPLCQLGTLLNLLGTGYSPETRLLPVFDEQEPEEVKVHRAMEAYNLNLLVEDRDNRQYPAISAENQIIWLNETNNEKAYERVSFLKNKKTDFSSIGDYLRLRDISIDEELNRALTLDGYTLTANENIWAYVITARLCGEACEYRVRISASAD